MRLDPHPSLVIHTSSDEPAVRRSALRGDLHHLFNGRYVRRDLWDLFDARERHLMVVFAALTLTSHEVIVSHTSAAAVWGFPRLGPWPERAHFIAPSLRASTSTKSSMKHAARVPLHELRSQFGHLVTSPAWTAVDLALRLGFRQAVIALDHGLHTGLFSRDDLVRILSERGDIRGAVKARAAIDFADERADRAAESLSRVVMKEGLLPIPTLQYRFPNREGPDAVVDFYWEDLGVVGEVDGETKYRDSYEWSGLSPIDVVIKEKNRGNWVLRQPGVRALARWDWTDVVTPGQLAKVLIQVGVHSARRVVKND